MVARRHGVFGVRRPFPELGQRHAFMPRQDALACGAGAIPDDASSRNAVDGLGDDGDGGSMTGYFTDEYGDREELVCLDCNIVLAQGPVGF